MKSDQLIDIHCHILPDLDDGAKNIDQALALAQQAYQQGISTIIATPHYIEGTVETNPEEITQACQQLTAKLKAQQIELTIQTGQEVYLSPDTALHYQEGKILTLAQSSYLLIELPMHQYPLWVEESLYELTLLGLRPILAHPERYREFRKSTKELHQLAASGLLMQINAGSILGQYGSKVEAQAEKLLEEGLISFIGSDAHSPQNRPIQISQALTKLQTWGLEPQKLIANNHAIIKGEEPPYLIKKEKSWWKKIWAFS
ncbi:capsular biosynthesis protein [Heliorestis acidaminivorans]|uniref:protein-tyrosine-phosphatase n=1 Tax=Heliorestis acidaminivorans TaxID=553427 RepID=A0A6I0EUB0_9FIRM|nr:CpsB/CapC family capsule biosynthesis tyrosine phosphatase [Heliorestis acidaminivorans]KAB2953774.1 capsular biosynthesis protein [Heliorestis acidaminivorans]